MENISYAKTVYGQEEIDAVVKCLNESTQMGNYARKFESEIAKLFDKKECLYVNSGSSALFIGIEAYDFPKEGEVITAVLTFGTTVGCLIKNNLVPVFVDVEPLTYCIDTKEIEKAITSKTVAILAPNLMGNLCDWPEIRKIADKHNLIVIEDSADKKIIEKAKLLRSWGRSSSLFDEKSEAIENRFDVNLDGIEYDAKFVFEAVGYNVEGSEIGAAFGMEQLKKLRENIKVRKNNFNRQCNFFDKHKKYFSNPVEKENINTAWLAFPILINKDAPFSRKEFQIYLEKRKIQTRVVFTGNVVRQPMMKNVKYKVTGSGYKNADAVMERGVLLPLHHGLTDSMFKRLHKTISEFLEGFK